MKRSVSVAVWLEGWVDTAPAMTISGLCLQAGQVEPGDACVVRNRNEAVSARERGAALLVHDHTVHLPDPGIPAVAVPGLSGRLGELAARFYRYPGEEMKLAAVTGRSGRTSAAHYIAQSWQRIEGAAALVGRNGSGPFRTPAKRVLDALEPVTLTRTLAECLDAGIGMAALELTPGFLDRGWADELAIDVAVFTSAEAPDGSTEGAPGAAGMRRLFTDCRPQFAVINHDEAEGKTLSRLADDRTQVLTYGTNGATELQGAISNMDSTGMTVRIASPWGGGELRTGLLGRRNLSHLLAAAGALALLGMNWNRIMHQVEIMSAAPGRMNCIAGEPGRPVAVLDSARTPAALEDVLTALRSHLHGRLHCVLTGTRDPVMRRVAESMSDRVFMANGGLRRAAIRRALTNSREGDILLIAGDWGDGAAHGGAATVLGLLEEVA